MDRKYTKDKNVMKFEAIKEKAKVLFQEGVQQYGGTSSKAAFDALLPFALATKTEREEMRVFAESFQAHRTDWLAQSAKGGKGWSQIVLQAREAGLQLIDNWDVRKVGKLIELFPGSVPAQYRGKQLTCYMADNEDCDWMVEAAQPEPSLERSRPEVRIDVFDEATDARVEALPGLQKYAGAAYTLYQVASKALQSVSGDANAVNWGQVHQDVWEKAVGRDQQPAATVLDAIKRHSPGAITPEQIAAVEAMGASRGKMQAPKITDEAIKRLLAAPVEVKLWNGCFNVATAVATFAKHRFELEVEVTHPLLQWQCGNKSDVTLTLWKSSNGVRVDLPVSLGDKIAEMRSAATMTDDAAARLSSNNQADFSSTMEELGITQMTKPQVGLKSRDDGPEP